MSVSANPYYLLSEERWPPCICIMCLVFPDRLRAFPSDAHRFSLHVLNCNTIFEFKEWCYTLEEIAPCCGHYSTEKCGGPLQCYPVTKVCFVHCSFQTSHSVIFMDNKSPVAPAKSKTPLFCIVVSNEFSKPYGAFCGDYFLSSWDHLRSW